jgi:hypothetical protein
MKIILLRKYLVTYFPPPINLKPKEPPSKASMFFHPFNKYYFA